ncbi:pseudouridine synthase [Enterococcus sp. LJL99]
MRLDKFLSEVGLGSRKEVKQLLKKKVITVNGQVVSDGKKQVNEITDKIAYLEEELTYQEFYYYLLNKPQGVISATEDKRDETVIDLLSDQDFREDLFPVGRLDKDTEGLLLLTNDGQLAHQLLAPKKHVDKEYYAIIDGIVTEEDCQLFRKGFALKSGETVKPSQLTIETVAEEKNRSMIRLVIQEGKFHQVKRMFEAVDKKVTYLKRLRMGSLWLDEALALGDYRPLTETELEQLKNNKK